MTPALSPRRQDAVTTAWRREMALPQLPRKQQNDEPVRRFRFSGRLFLIAASASAHFRGADPRPPAQVVPAPTNTRTAGPLRKRGRAAATETETATMTATRRRTRPRLGRGRRARSPERARERITRKIDRRKTDTRRWIRTTSQVATRVSPLARSWRNSRGFLISTQTTARHATHLRMRLPDPARRRLRMSAATGCTCATIPWTSYATSPTSRGTGVA